MHPINPLDAKSHRVRASSSVRRRHQRSPREPDHCVADHPGADNSGIVDSAHRVLAGMIPVPSRSVAPAMAAILERAIFLRFEHAEELDAWIHTSLDALGGASPFELLIEGEAMSVLRAMTAVPLLSQRAADAPDDVDESPLRLVG